MAIQARDRKGRAKARYDDSALQTAVKEVAEKAAPADPSAVTQTAFDRARAAAGHEDLPTARAICMRLGRHGKSVAWRELLTLVFDDSRCPDRAAIGRARRNGQEGRHLGERHLFFGLNRVAQHLGLDPEADFSQPEYEEGRRQVLALSDRRPADREILEQLLPTANQIQRIAAALEPSDLGHWDRALRAVGRRARPTPGNDGSRMPKVEVGLALPVAIHYFIEANKRMPSSTALLEFGRKLGIRVEHPKRGRRWADVLDEARRYRAELGIETPYGNPKAGGRAVKKEIKIPTDGIPDAPPAGTGRLRSRYSRQDCIEAIVTALNELAETEPGVTLTRTRYLQASKGGRLPAPNLLDRHGTWSELLAEARKYRQQQQ